MLTGAFVCFSKKEAKFAAFTVMSFLLLTAFLPLLWINVIVKNLLGMLIRIFALQVKQKLSLLDVSHVGEEIWRGKCAESLAKAARLRKGNMNLVAVLRIDGNVQFHAAVALTPAFVGI